MPETASPPAPRSIEARFRSAADIARYRATYDAVLALWPVPHESVDLVSDFGVTHVNIAGKAGLPPLILIPGAQMSSTVWYPNVGPLSQRFRVYAPDVIDQTGLSVPVRRLVSQRDTVAWLTALMNSLSIDSAALVGHSQGCWQALSMAVEMPGRVSRMVLLSPGPPFAAVRWQMFARMVPLFIRPTPRMFYWNLQWLTTLRLDPEQPDPLAELFVAGALSFRPDELSFGSYPTFDDHTLRAITIPTLLLTGDHERVVSPQKVINRAARLMPRMETGLISEAGHLLPVDQPEEVNARMLAFLTAPG